MEIESIYLAGGCFWCVEAVFERIPGVIGVQSGYMGGHVANPTYEAVCRGDTGHAEVVEVQFPPSRLSLEQILQVFWLAHDPTTLNRQGADVGTQYRSAIFFTNEAQAAVVRASVAALEKSGKLSDPVVTQIEKAGAFFPAESYHDRYFTRNGEQSYCAYVIAPKLKKLGLS